MTIPVSRKIYCTDLNIGLTFFGDVKMLNSTGNDIELILDNVTVYDYPSSNYSHSLPQISLNGPIEGFHIEDAV